MGSPLDFSALSGMRIPGGCDDCDAYQTVGDVAPGVWSLVVHHDDTCPGWLRIRRVTDESDCGGTP